MIASEQGRPAHFACMDCMLSLECFAAYLVVADEAYGRQIPFAFLERVRDEFSRDWAEKSRAAPAHSLDKTFG